MNRDWIVVGDVGQASEFWRSSLAYGGKTVLKGWREAKGFDPSFSRDTHWDFMDLQEPGRMGLILLDLNSIAGRTLRGLSRFDAVIAAVLGFDGGFDGGFDDLARSHWVLAHCHVCGARNLDAKTMSSIEAKLGRSIHNLDHDGSWQGWWRDLERCAAVKAGETV